MSRSSILLALLLAASLGAPAALAQTPPPVQPAGPVVPAATVAPTTIDLPVLTSPKEIHGIVQAEDITLQSFPIKRVHGDMIRDDKQIIGMAAKHQLSAGQPLHLSDLEKEQVVLRGEDVLIIYHSGALEITASGKAQEGGAMGDVIRVTNTGSNRGVDAKITGDKKVEVTQ